MKIYHAVVCTFFQNLEKSRKVKGKAWLNFKRSDV